MSGTYSDSSDEDGDIQLSTLHFVTRRDETALRNDTGPVAGPSWRNDILPNVQHDRGTSSEDIPSVAFPGVRNGSIVYYDGKGHFFHKHTETMRKR